MRLPTPVPAQGGVDCIARHWTTPSAYAYSGVRESVQVSAIGTPMGLLDGLFGMLGGGDSANIVGSLLGATQAGETGQGGMAGMLESLVATGLGQHVASWMSDNPNLPISPDQLRDALGSEQAQQMAASSGLPVGDFLKHLAEHLPAAAAAQTSASEAGASDDDGGNA